MEAPGAIAKTKTLARQALELDPMSAYPHYLVGAVTGAFEWDWDEAERAFEEARRLNPNVANGRFWYGLFCLAPTGRLDQAIAELQYGLGLEPLSPLMHTTMGIALMLRRDYPKAIEAFRAALELDPNFPMALGYLGETYCHLHDYEKAARELRRARSSDRTPPGCPFSAGLLGYCYGRSGKTGDAERLLSELQERSETTYIPAVSFATTYLGMDDADRAVEWLERAYDEACGTLVWLSLEPIYDPLRSDPRFQALLQRMHFPSAGKTGAVQ